MSSWKWYGVKVLYEIKVTGEPDAEKLDEYYEENRCFAEESIILVRAQSIDHAYKIAEKEAMLQNDIYTSEYGQTVEWKFYEAIDCFRMFDKPASKVEIYSCIFKHAGDMNALADSRLGAAIKQMRILSNSQFESLSHEDLVREEWKFDRNI